MVLSCSKCKQEKESTFFCNDARRKLGKSSHCLDCMKARSAKFRKLFPEKAEKSVRSSQLKKKYGLTPAEYDLLFSSQKGLCAICGELSDRRLDVDHCHTSGKIRALLCRYCNLGIGNFKDSIYKLLKAVDYLKEHN